MTGTRKIWKVMEMFYILNIVVATQLYIVKTNGAVH